MSEMIEKVARAMWEVRREKARLAHIDLEEWGDGFYPRANHIMEEARAAIEAMREPTAKMIDAAEGVGIVDCEPGCMCMGVDHSLGWQAMIDEALEP